MNGYCGKILRVDLGRSAVTDELLSPEIARAFVGGSGLAARLFFEAVAPAYEGGVGLTGFPDPLGPDNPLIIATGPLTGTRFPCSGRFTVSARSPLTGIWGEANVGGFFGPELKFAGYDAVVVTGRAPVPVYLLIDRGMVTIEPAADLWGKDCYETDDLLAAKHGGEGQGGRAPQILAIGPAGENLVHFAAIVHRKHHVAGRAGMGAVMGSKNLKAVVARGSGGAAGRAETFPLADPDKVKELASAFTARAKENMVTKSLGEAGTIMGMDLGGLIGDVPIRNWAQGAWGEELEKIGVGGYGEYLTGSGTCFSCPVGCKRKVSAEALGHKLDGAPGAEYETLCCLGPLLLISDLPAILVLGEITNRLGMDTISAGGTLAYAFEAAERGLLDGGVLERPGAGDLSGCVAKLKTGWGNPELVARLLENMAYRRCAGATLADGSAALARRIGKPEAFEFLATVKGMEPPAHDARAAHGMGIAYATSNRGACHMNSLMYGSEHAGVLAPEAGIESDGLQQSSAGKGLLNKAVEDLAAVWGQSAVLCQLGGNMYCANDLVDMLNASTGFDYSLAEVLECGARIWHLKRGLNNLYGMTAADDRLPPRLLLCLEDGGAAGSVPDMDLMLGEWMEARGLAPSGFAKPEVLEGLRLGWLAALLGRQEAAKAGR